MIFGFLFCALIAGFAEEASGVSLFLLSFICMLVLGDLFYSRFISKHVFGLCAKEPVPSKDPSNKDDIDYKSTDINVLFGHHFTSIAGAAPIAGPAIAAYWGWLPGMAWIVFGVIFAGAIHDMGTLIISTRNEAGSIVDQVGRILGWRSRVIFFCVVAFLCWIVIAVFENFIANLFIAYPETVLPIWFEVAVAMTIGWGVTKRGWKLFWPSVLALILLYAMVFVGVAIEDARPADDKLFKMEGLCVNSLVDDCAFGQRQVWTVVLGVYTLVASVLPVWLLMQPRDYINSHQLEVCMLGLVIGLIAYGPTVAAPVVREDTAGAPDMFPFLFVTIACGALSGFHGLVSSTVTSKQIASMPDCRAVGYAGMIGEGTLAALVLTICCCVVTTENSDGSYVAGGMWGTDSYLSYSGNVSQFINGGGILLQEFGFDASAARSIVVILFVSFAATTLDTGMRIQRMLLSEFGRYMLTSAEKSTMCEGLLPIIRPISWCLTNIFMSGLIAIVPAVILANTETVSSLWNLFGATNQLVAALSMTTIAIYIATSSQNVGNCYWVLYGIPAFFVIIMTGWALCDQLDDWFNEDDTTADEWLRNIIGVIIFAFVCWFVVEVFFVVLFGQNKEDSNKKSPESNGEKI